MAESTQIKGLALAISGVLVISPDTLLIRFLSIDFWAVMCLRGLFIALALLVIARGLKARQGSAGLGELDRYAVAMIFLIAFSSFFFVAAVQMTSVAHALIIVGSAPVFAALFGWLMLGEKVSTNTSITMAIVIVSLGFVVSDQQESHLTGDLLALVACLSWSLNFVLARRSRSRDMSSVMMYSGMLMAIAALPLAVFDGVTLDQFAISAVLGILNGVALFLLVTAPRFIPAAEVAVFLPVETVLGSFLVWWILGEYPGLISVAAGLTIVFALIANSLYQLRRVRQ